jgi:hypothetical protein
VRKVSHDVDQAGKIAESIETANEELFRDFDLSTFMEHFKLDALEKTILALAFKTTSRSDLKTKGMLSPWLAFQYCFQLLLTYQSRCHSIRQLRPLLTIHSTAYPRTRRSYTCLSCCDSRPVHPRTSS